MQAQPAQAESVRLQPDQSLINPSASAASSSGQNQSRTSDADEEMAMDALETLQT